MFTAAAGCICGGEDGIAAPEVCCLAHRLLAVIGVIFIAAGSRFEPRETQADLVAAEVGGPLM